jgi:glycosyltransferase involved in cell wall biosynthesis
MAGNTINIFSRSGHLGGMEFRVLDETQWLNNHGWDAKAYFSPFTDWQRLIGLGQDRGVSVDRLPLPLFLESWRMRHLRGWHAKLVSHWFRRRLDSEAVHVPFAWTEQGMSPLWFAAQFSRRIVISVHNVFPVEELNSWQFKWMQEAFNKVTGIYGVSPAATRAFQEIFETVIRPDTVLETIPNYVDVDRFQPSEQCRASMRSRLGFSEKTRVIGSLGRISAQKRPVMLVDVFARMLTLAPDTDLRLLLIGGGELKEEVLLRAADHGIQEQIIITDFVPNPEDYLSAVDVNVLASTREGCPLAALEAMAAGVPVVLTDVPGSRSVLDQKRGCVFVPRDDVDAIARTLNELIGDRQQLRERGAQARREAVSEFSRPVWDERLDRFYSHALGTKKDAIL